MVVKVVGTNNGSSTPQLNQNVEVKVGNNSVAFKGSPGGGAQSNQRLMSAMTPFQATLGCAELTQINPLYDLN